MAAMIIKVPPLLRGAARCRSRTPVSKPALVFAFLAGVRRFKTAPGGFVSSRAPLMRAVAEVRGA